MTENVHQEMEELMVRMVADVGYETALIIGMGTVITSTWKDVPPEIIQSKLLAISSGIAAVSEYIE